MHGRIGRIAPIVPYFAAGQHETYRLPAASHASYRTVHVSTVAANSEAPHLHITVLRRRIVLIVAMAAGLLAATAATARAQGAPPDSTGLLIRLGADTLAVERVVTYADSITGDFVTRSPHTSRYTYTAHTSPAPDRVVTAYSMAHYRTGLTSSPVDVRVTADFASESAHVIVQRKDSSHAMSYSAPRTTVPLLEPGFGLHQILIARAIAAHGHVIPFAWVYVPDQVDTGSVMVGPRDDTVRITTPTDTIRATVDAKGRVLAMTDPGGTLQASVTRIPWPDLDRWGNEFMDRDAHGKALGMLSTRDTVRATVGAATLIVDYSRPSRRGREIFGNIVPWNTVWRTGANWATSLVTNKDLRIGGTLVPAGSYTIFTIPAPTGWTLIVSRKTGEWGTEYDPSADLVRIPMTSRSSAQPTERFTIAVTPRGPGSALMMSWDTVTATVLLRGVGR
jgi:Protein of unknown function (DUF2911)